MKIANIIEMLRFPASHLFDGCHDVRMGVCRRIHPGRNLLRSYYEVLGVTKDCTTKEIKAAYLQLCKELHPDRRPQASEKQFIELNDAYTTLIKPSTRAAYDSRLTYDDHRYKSVDHRYKYNWMRTSGYPENHSFRAQNWYDETIFQRGKRRENYTYEGSGFTVGPYPNYVIVLGCILLLFIGACTHYVSYRRTEERNKELLTSYLEMRQQAIEIGDKKQTAILMEKLGAATKIAQEQSAMFPVHS